MSLSLVVISEPNFERDFKRLRKKYRLIGEDLRGLLRDFETLGIHGDRMAGYVREVRKVRLTNRSANRGKSGGFRALFVVENETTIRLFRLYSKTEESSISRSEIRRAIRYLP